MDNIGNNWRPKVWENPYPIYDESSSISRTHRAFEEGASAIIPAVEAEVLRRMGEWLQSRRCVTLHLGLANYTLMIADIEALQRGELPEEVKHD